MSYNTDKTGEKLQSAERDSKPVQIYDNSVFYDTLYPGYPGDKEFYLDHIKSGNVLYLGVGTGRLFGDIYRRNNKSIGIDSSESMLAILKKKYEFIPSSNVIHHDVRTYVPTEKYDTVIAPYSFFNFFNRSELSFLLKNVHKWLKDGGNLITDSFSPFKNPPFNKETEKFEYNKLNVHICTDIQYFHCQQYLIEKSTIISENQIDNVVLKNYYYYPNETRQLFEDAGFKTCDLYSGFELNKLNTNDEIMVAINRK